jgi:hypothetical protein
VRKNKRIVIVKASLNTTTKLLFCALLVMGLSACATSTSYDGPTSLLLLGDTSGDGVDRGSKEYRRGYGAFAGVMADGGFDVMDEAAAALDDFTLNEATSRADLLDIARSMRTSADAVVMYSPSVTVVGDRIRVTVLAEAMSINGGRIIASADASETKRLPGGCNRYCQSELSGDGLAQMSRQVASELVTKLGGPIKYTNPKAPNARDVRVGASTSYKVVLNGFDASESSKLQDHLGRIKGNQSSRVVYSDNRRTEIQYQTRTMAGSIVQQLDAYAESMGINARVRFAGGEILVDKVSKRIKRDSDRTLDDSGSW